MASSTPPTPNRLNVLIISREELLIKEVTKVLEADKEFVLADYSYLADGVVSAVNIVEPDIVLFDYMYSPFEEILDVIDEVAIHHPNVDIIVVLPEEGMSRANQIILAGARAFLPYPFSHVNLLSTMRRVRELHTRIAASALPSGFSTEKVKPDRNFLVFSPKGGVGCTTVTTNLAIALYNELNEEVLLVDGKVLFGHVALMLNLKTANSIIDLIPRVGSFDENLVRQVIVKHASGIHVLPAPFSATMAQSIRPDDLFNVHQGLLKIFPNTIVDGGNYLNEQVVTLMDSAHRIILVITPDLASLRDARLFLDICRTLSYPRGKILLIMNKVRGKNDVTHSEIEKALRMKIFGLIPADENQVLGCLNEGVPLILKHPNHAISKGITKIAKSLLELGMSTSSKLQSEPPSELILRSSRLG